jgi:type VI secretion system secreted protein VgrG
MFLFRFLRRRRDQRRPQAPRLNCVELEGRQLLTAVTGPRVRPATAVLERAKPQKSPRLGTPNPTQSSAYASLKAAPGTPKVFQDASEVRATQGLDGSGFAVAVIDTGVDYNLNALGNGFGAGHKVIAGFDFGMQDGDPSPTWNHGTAVSSVIAANDPANPGIAPGADIVALRVFDDGGNSTFARIADALEWVVANHKQHNITVVNISLSDSMNYTLNWFRTDTGAGQRVTDAVAKLKSLDIAVVSAAGNSFKGREGMGFTAIIKETVSVTGVDPNTGQLAANAQRLGTSVSAENATDIAAPSSGFRAITGNGSYESVDGTSFAAPIVSGSIVLMQQKYFREFGKLPSVSQIESWLKQGGTATNDPVTNLQIKQIDLAGSLGLIPTKPTSPVVVIPPSEGPKPPVVTPTQPSVPTPPPVVVVTPPPVVVVTPPAAVVTPPVVVATPPMDSVEPQPASGSSGGGSTPTTNTPATPAAPVVRINGSLANVTKSSGAAVSLDSLQNGIRWHNVQIWTGEAVAQRSDDTDAQPVPTGTLRKRAIAQRAPQRSATRVSLLRRNLPRPGRTA